ncbi:MAG: hypothetical protein NUV86_09500 [Candidatus Scalindua sp.]|nr:hypothetical protein [Candidatus Scalindua sp.]
MKKVFCDLHHIGLYRSLQILFEERLGWELYRPIGEDWAIQGHWLIAQPYGNNPGTIRQFLGTDTHAWESYKFLNGDYVLEDNIYHIYDPITKTHQKAITLDTFKEMKFDIILSSYQPHDKTFADLISRYQPQAKHIAQMGNIFQTTDVKNVMCSTKPYPVPEGKNVVFYHQEFDLNIFKYKEPVESLKITNFVNLHPAQFLYDCYKGALPDYEFKSYGASCPDGTITGEQNIADIMAASTFGFHVKPKGDGFGHVLHNWYACGRPVITNGSDYADKLGGELLIDGKTCLNLESCGFQENVNRIHYWSIPENHQEMCRNARDQFTKVVNYDEEFERIKQFLSNIL